MIAPHEMHAAMEFCVEHGLSPVLLSSEGKYIVALDPKMLKEAVDRAWSYHRTQPRIGIDLDASKCLAITTRIGSGDAAITALEGELGAIMPIVVQCRFEQDGQTASARHVQAVHLERWPHEAGHPAVNLREGELTVAVRGYAPLASSMPIEPLNEKWTAFIEGIPIAQPVREKKALEEEIAWRNGTHPSQKPNADAKRLREPFKLMHGSALLDLPTGAVIDDPGLLGTLEAAGAIIGNLDEAPPVRNLKPGESRFRAAVKAVMGHGGWRSYHEGEMLTGVSQGDVDEICRAGAVVDYEADVLTESSITSRRRVAEPERRPNAWQTPSSPALRTRPRTILQR